MPGTPRERWKSDESSDNCETCQAAYGSLHAPLPSWIPSAGSNLRRGSLTKKRSILGPVGGLFMSRVVRLGPHDWPVDRPFTHPGLASRDCDILIGLLRDVGTSRHVPPQVESPTRDRDRLVITRSGRQYQGGPLTIVGFFGERNPAGPEGIADAVEEVNARMVADFDHFPVLLAYVSRLLDDGFNYANLVVLSGADGIEAWRDLPEHEDAAADLAPDFYNSVRIYNGSVASGLDHPQDLALHVVKFWDYRGQHVWHATRELDQAD